MQIADNVIREKLKNVYFIWGRGKTTIANMLNKKYGFFVYEVDKYRNIHVRNADSFYQPTMVDNYTEKYSVKDFWELPKEVIKNREKQWLLEFTPMAIVDLIGYSMVHPIIICEGDLDYQTIISISSNIIYLLNHGTKFDFFNRNGHDTLENIKNRKDLTAKKKAEIIKNAYDVVNEFDKEVPKEIANKNIKQLIYTDDMTVEETVKEVALYFGFKTDEQKI